KRAVLADRPLLHAMGVVNVIRTDGRAENSGEMRGDFRGAEQHIAGKLCLTAVARRAAIVLLRGFVRPLGFVAGLARGLASGSGTDGGVGRSRRTTGVSLIVIGLSRVHRGASVAIRNGLDFFSVSTSPICGRADGPSHLRPSRWPLPSAAEQVAPSPHFVHEVVVLAFTPPLR